MDRIHLNIHLSTYPDDDLDLFTLLSLGRATDEWEGLALSIEALVREAVANSRVARKIYRLLKYVTEARFVVVLNWTIRHLIN